MPQKKQLETIESTINGALTYKRIPHIFPCQSKLWLRSHATKELSDMVHKQIAYVGFGKVLLNRGRCAYQVGYLSMQQKLL